MDAKICRDCKVQKPLEEFYANKNYRLDGRDVLCKPCRKLAIRTYKDNNRDHVNAVQREWSRKRYGWNPAQPGLTSRQRTLQKYNMTIDDYDAMYESQNGQCKICQRKFDLLVVDHCHSTGTTRGLLCRACNRGIGMLSDDPIIIMRAYEYLVL